LRMGAYTRKDNVEIEKDISMVFDKFPGLRPLGERYGGTLSGGEQQMLALGRALVARPRLMLMDEPSMGLAPFLVDRVFETIINLRGEGRTILLVEQNAQMALSIADRGYVLEVGNITMHGNAKDLRENEELRISYIGV
jgi:branched-chain amino acid transport system ATP-binding protein